MMRRPILMLAAAAVLVLTSCGGQDPSSSPTPGETSEQVATSTTGPQPERWTTHRDKEHGLEVSYPGDWYRSEESLTPSLGDPKEILSLGTYPLRPGGDRCAHYPVNALQDLGPDDAFVSLLERAEPYPASGYPPRPSRFELPSESGTNGFCVPYTRRLDEWLAFSDAGRAFYLLVALGESASEETKTELLTILNSLRFG
jgi:hypothetical protein